MNDLMMYKQIDDFVKKLITENETADPFRILKLNDMQVVYHFDSFKGICVKVPSDCIYISLRNDLSALDKFFNVAHELYHALLDFKDTGKVFVKHFSKESCALERNANYFAYRLLLEQDENILEDFYNENPLLDKSIDKIIHNLAYSGL